MKRRDLIRKLTDAGCLFVRHGRKHDIYENTDTNKRMPVPRHREIKESTAKHILKALT